MRWDSLLLSCTKGSPINHSSTPLNILLITCAYSGDTAKAHRRQIHKGGRWGRIRCKI